MARPKQTEEEILNKIFYVKDVGCTTGRFTIGRVMEGKEVKLKLISSPPFEAPRHMVSQEEALNKVYKVGRNGRILTPMILIGARVKIIVIKKL